MTTQQYNQIGLLLANAHRDYWIELNKRAFFKLSDHMLGQDLVQDTFLKTWKYLLKGGKIKKMKDFLYHVLNDLIIDEYRKNKPESLDALVKKGFKPSVDELPILINKLDSKKALLLIKQLPLKYRKVMHMRYVQDLTLKEISEINGQLENTNAVQIHRGIQMIESLSKKKRKSK